MSAHRLMAYLIRLGGAGRAAPHSPSLVDCPEPALPQLLLHSKDRGIANLNLHGGVKSTVG